MNRERLLRWLVPMALILPLVVACSTPAAAPTGQAPTRASAPPGTAPALAQSTLAPTASPAPATATPLPPTATPLPPTATPLPPTVTLVPTPTPTPDLALLATALSPLVSGQGVPGAAQYDPGRPGPHRVVLLTQSGGAYEDWNMRLPSGWSSASLDEVELVVLIGPEREVVLGSQGYDRGPDIIAYRYQATMELLVARTGKKLKTLTFKGTDPRPFPATAPLNQTRLEGTHFKYADLESAACPTILGQGCWGLVHVFEGQLNRASDFAFSPDGRTLASSSEGTIVLWDAATGRERLTFGDRSPTNGPAVAFSPDGRTLASTSADTTIVLWATADGTRLHTLEAGAYTQSLAFSADGRTLASGLSDGTIVLWDTASGSRLIAFSGEPYPVSTIALSPDGRTLASSSGGGALILWDVASATQIHELPLSSHTSWLAGLAFSPDGRTLASGGSWGQGIILWDVATGTLLRTVEAKIEATCVAFAPDGRTLASSGGWNDTVILWDVASGARLQSLGAGVALPVLGVAFSPDGRTLANGSSDGTVRIWQLDFVPKKPKPTRTPAAPTQPGGSPGTTAVPGGAGQPVPFQTITCPAPGVAITAITASARGWWNISGSADIPNLDYWKGEISADGQAWTVLYRSSSPVRNGVLIEFNTGTVPRGTYQIRLMAIDRTGNYPEPCIIQVSTQ